MKILVSTKETQGQRKNDFCHVPEGEIVTFATECDGESVDGHCGCRRSMIGVECMHATTTIKVVDDPNLTYQKFQDIIMAYMKKWHGDSSLFKESELRKMALQETRELLKMASYFDIGAGLEKRGAKFQERRSEEKFNSTMEMKKFIKVGMDVSIEMRGSIMTFRVEKKNPTNFIGRVLENGIPIKHIYKIAYGFIVGKIK